MKGFVLLVIFAIAQHQVAIGLPVNAFNEEELSWKNFNKEEFYKQVDNLEEIFNSFTKFENALYTKYNKHDPSFKVVNEIMEDMRVHLGLYFKKFCQNIYLFVKSYLEFQTKTVEDVVFDKTQGNTDQTAWTQDELIVNQQYTPVKNNDDKEKSRDQENLFSKRTDPLSNEKTKETETINTATDLSTDESVDLEPVLANDNTRSEAQKIPDDRRYLRAPVSFSPDYPDY